MTGNQLREEFLEFFKSKNHLIERSYSLIPENDPTLLIIGAGMAPFKPFFTGKVKPPHPRIATSQKCVRTGDIENVGHTARHHTFFEMLGNFSFGDYFKKEAISWAWEFLIDRLELPKDKLWISIYPKDDEAFDIWLNDIKIPAERIIRLKDNFWEIGPGPCGPCSEIYIDLGEERGCGEQTCSPGCDCDRYLEIWNLVFTQFEKDEASNYTPLAKKNIDTGAGLERIASVLQNKPSNFETDLLFPIIEYTANLAGVTYGSSAKINLSLKVIADHARSMTMMIADGILPSNEGRGYVLRRIIRRAVRHGRLIGIGNENTQKNFLGDIVNIVAEIFTQSYPEITEKKEYIKKVIQLEEERFQKTLLQGMELLNKEISELRQKNNSTLSGITAFKLYDTFGFPLELTQEILNEHNISIDKPGFEKEMEEQKIRAREGRAEKETKFSMPDLSKIKLPEQKHDIDINNAKIILLLKDSKIAQEVFDGDEAAVILDSTPFYAEGGGQVGDTGHIFGSFGRMSVLDTKKLPDGTIYHICRIEEGFLKLEENVNLKVDTIRSKHIARNHTATHLLHTALKKVLGEHINQAGSLVDEDKLRFDFTHFSVVTEEELVQVEKLVNSIILDNRNINIIHTTQDLAKEMGAVALFGEKYGDKVRVVVVDDFSKELCGGLHVGTTSQVGLFKITGESGIGSGLRRIEAVTGQGAYEHLNNTEGILKEAAAVLKCRPEDIAAKIDSVFGKIKSLEKERSSFKNELAKNEVDQLLAEAQFIGDAQDGLQMVVGQIKSVADMETLRSTGDMIRDKLKNDGVVVLGAVLGDKVNFLAMATSGAISRGIHAGNIVKAAAQAAGGGGGGRADMAQAGGKIPANLPQALAAARQAVCTQIDKK